MKRFLVEAAALCFVPVYISMLALAAISVLTIEFYHKYAVGTLAEKGVEWVFKKLP